MWHGNIQRGVWYGHSNKQHHGTAQRQLRKTIGRILEQRDKKRSLWRLYYCINPGKMVWILLDTSARFIPHPKISGQHQTRVCNKIFTCIYSLPHLFYCNKQSYRGDSPTGVWYELLWHRSQPGSLFEFFSLLLPSPPRLTGERRGVVYGVNRV